MTVASYVPAATVADAVAAMAAGARPVAGGTDLVVGSRQGKRPLPEALVGIHRIAGLSTIAHFGGAIEMGALVSHAAIVLDDIIRERFTALADASMVVGSHATRAHGTIGGNVMNASPAMDTGAPLLCLGATASFASASGTRTVDLAELWSGPGTTTAAPDELLVAINLPAPSPDSGSAYVRLQYRRQMEIAVVGGAAAVTFDGPNVTAAAIAITAVAPVIHRVLDAEQALTGTAAEEPAVQAAAEVAAAATRPIDDVRASAGYRRAMTAVVVRRAIEAAVARARGDEVIIPATESTQGT